MPNNSDAKMTESAGSNIPGEELFPNGMPSAPLFENPVETSAVIEVENKEVPIVGDGTVKFEAIGFDDLPDIFVSPTVATPVSNEIPVTATNPIENPAIAVPELAIPPISPELIIMEQQAPMEIVPEQPIEMSPMLQEPIIMEQQVPMEIVPEQPIEMTPMPQAPVMMEASAVPELDLAPMSPSAIMTELEPQLIPAIEAPVVPELETPESLQESGMAGSEIQLITPEITPEIQPPLIGQNLDISAIANSLEEPMSNMNSLSSMLPPTLEAITPVSAGTPIAEEPVLPPLGSDITNASVAPAIPNLIPTAPGIIPSAKKEVVVGSKSSLMIVIIFSLLSLAVMVWFGFIILENSDNKEKDLGIQNTREYTYEGFSLYLPENLVAEIVDGEFFITDKENTWSAVITLQPGAFHNLVSNKSQLTDYYESFGYISEDPNEKEIHGTRFVLMEVSMGAEKVLVAYAKATGTQIFGIILTNEAHEYSDSSLADIGKLLATSKYNGPTSAWPEGFTVDMFKETFKIAE